MRLLVATIFMILAGSAEAQHHQHSHGQYAGFATRTIKALSDQQVADLRAGRGMGMALVAELNGYPGPMHVLEHARSLELSPEQHSRIQALFDQMKREAITSGERLIEAEVALDLAFKDRNIDPVRLADLSLAIGKMQGELRAIHLKYHLSTSHLLGPEQLKQYAELRGYR